MTARPAQTERPANRLGPKKKKKKLKSRKVALPVKLGITSRLRLVNSRTPSPSRFRALPRFHANRFIRSAVLHDAYANGDIINLEGTAVRLAKGVFARGVAGPLEVGEFFFANVGEVVVPAHLLFSFATLLDDWHGGRWLGTYMRVRGREKKLTTP